MDGYHQFLKRTMLEKNGKSTSRKMVASYSPLLKIPARFQGIFGKTWFSMVNTSFSVDGRHDTLKKDGAWSWFVGVPFYHGKGASKKARLPCTCGCRMQAWTVRWCPRDDPRLIHQLNSWAFSQKILRVHFLEEPHLLPQISNRAVEARVSAGNGVSRMAWCFPNRKLHSAESSSCCRTGGTVISFWDLYKNWLPKRKNQKLRRSIRLG